MILQALNDYYLRLEQDPESDVAPFGFSRQNVSFCIVLNKDGSLHEIQDIRKQDEKKFVKLSVLVPGNAKPSGSGINPCFLWDNPAYMLGYKPEDSKPDRTLKAFEAFRQRHLDVETDIGDPAFTTVCRFLESWDPAEAIDHPVLVELGTGFGLFKLRAVKAFVHERKTVQSWWRTQLENQEEADEDTIGQCLVTGEIGPLARLHEPKIKGVWGGQSSGAGIVSFNLDAFESYGKAQSFNAPVSEQVAFQYCTALNRLLASKQRLQIGDATVTYWTEKPSPAENWLGLVFDPPSAAEDESLNNQLSAVLKQISNGQFPSELGKPETPFYVLGLSPNAARISVRFWWRSTLGEVTKNLQAHFQDLAIDLGPKDREYPALWQLLRETARESKDIPPLLSGAVMRAILTGSRYPDALYSSVLRRVRADRELRYVRAAIIKAFLNRNYQKEISMSLDPDRPEPAYHLGRLFAELEKTQEDAMPGINDTIKDRYFGSASATPANVFPRLIRMSQHHLGKLEKPAKIYHEKRIQEIVDRLGNFSRHLNLQDQGLFAIGYYHQRQDIFTKKPSETKAATTEKE